MRIGIDISQLAYPGTGVATYLQHLAEHLISTDPGNEYVLFYSSMRKDLPDATLWKNGMPIIPSSFKVRSVTIKQFKIPPTILDILWNRLHIVPIETFIGSVDVFISSDWTQPPSKAKKTTVLYDLIVYKYPKETAEQIVAVQKRRLAWVKKEIDTVICISEATKKDAMEILGLPNKKLAVVYPGL